MTFLDGYQPAFWRRPEAYLDARIRAARSTFATLPVGRRADHATPRGRYLFGGLGPATRICWAGRRRLRVPPRRQPLITMIPGRTGPSSRVGGALLDTGRSVMSTPRRNRRRCGDGESETVPARPRPSSLAR